MSGETKRSESGWTVDTLKEYLEQRIATLEKADFALREINDERDRLYKERDESRRTAVDAALTAVKEQTKASFEASEKAIVKAEEAQKSYNASHNDLARKMDEQNKATMPRTETESRFSSLGEKVEELRRTLAQGGGLVSGGKAVKDESRANTMLIVSLLMAFVGFIGLVFGAITVALRLAGR